MISGRPNDVERDCLPALSRSPRARSDLDLGANLICTVDFCDLDTFTVQAMLAPCGKPAEVKVEVQDSDMGIDYSFDYKAGDTEQIPVPGLSFDIPLLGSVGVVIDLGVSGNIDNLEISVAADGCGTLLGVTECGADLTSMLPIPLLDGTFNLGSFCGGVREREEEEEEEEEEAAVAAAAALPAPVEEPAAAANTVLPAHAAYVEKRVSLPRRFMVV